ncbi:MAG: cytochrome P450 [Polyangiales bacterium]
MTHPSSVPAVRARGVSPVGVLPRLVRDPLTTLTAIGHAHHGAVVEVPIGPGRLHLLTTPRQVTHVLHEQWKRFPKGEGGMWRQIRRLFGDGLVTVDGDAWVKNRRLLNPLFSRPNLEALADEMNASIAASLDDLEARCAGGRPVDLSRETARLTEHSLLRTIFGVNLAREREDELRDALMGAFAATMERMILFFVPDAVPLPGEVALRRGVRRLDDAVARLLQTRRADPSERRDLLSLLLRAKDDAAAPLADRRVRDEVVTMFFAGHDSTALAQAWALHLLARSPDVLDAVTDEVDRVLAGRRPTWGDLPALEHTRRVVLETLRLFPSGWLMPRTCAEDCAVDGYRLPAGAFLAVNLFALHRDPALWERPDAFDPARFAAGPDAFPRGQYLPFGAGPRTCIGDQFAMLMMQSGIAQFVQRFRPAPADRANVQPTGLGGSLRPARALMVRCLPRSRRTAPAAPPRDATVAPGLPLVGLLPSLLRDPLAALSAVRAAHGDVARFRVAGAECLLVSDPELAAVVLGERADRYTKESSLWEAAQALVGRGIGTTDGPDWERRRRALQPQFQRARMAPLLELTAREVRAQAGALAARSGGRVSLFREVRAMLSRVFFRAMFGASIGEGELDALLDAVRGSFEVVDRMLWTHSLPSWLPRPGGRRFREAVAVIDDTVYRVITQRLRDEAPADDLLGLLLASLSPRLDDPASMRAARDEVATMIIATQDGPSLMVGWALALLGQHPAWARQVRDEVDEALGGAPAAPSHLAKLPLTRAVLEEALRLYPPLWLTVRQAARDDVLGGVAVPAKGFVFLCPYAIQRDAAWWREPERFDPARFLPGGDAPAQRGTYLPFGHGPHVCIGRHYGLMLGQLLVAELTRRFELSLDDVGPIETRAMVTIQPRRPVTARFTLRPGVRQ